MTNILALLGAAIISVSAFTQDDPAPKETNVNVNSNAAIYKWDYDFHDAKSLFDAIRSSTATKLAEGSNENIIFVVIRERTS